MHSILLLLTETAAAVAQDERQISGKFLFRVSVIGTFGMGLANKWARGQSTVAH